MKRLRRIWRVLRRHLFPASRLPPAKAFPWLHLDPALHPPPYGMVLYEAGEMIHYANGIGGVVSMSKRRRTPTPR